MALLAKFALRLIGGREIHLLDAAARDPAAAQSLVLRQILERNSDTEFGRLHQFGDIASEAAYRERVPIRDYEGFRPYVERLLSGATGVLTAQQPLMLTKTSGTTGTPKLLPVTAESTRLERRLTWQWLARSLRDHPRLLNGKIVTITSSAIEEKSPVLPVGSASGVIAGQAPGFMRRQYAIPPEVAEIKDYDLRYRLAARFALATSASFVATPNPSTLIRLAEVAEVEADTIIPAIRDGALGFDLPDQGAIAARLATRLRPQPGRAEQLSRFVARTGRLRPAEYWPDLALIGCWTGGSVGSQLARMRGWYGDQTPVRDLGYIASEGRITIPVADGTPAGIPALNLNYLEFIPEDQLEKSEPTALSVHQLETGQRYAVVLTTRSGLYRYDINDIVEVVGWYARCPPSRVRAERG